MGYINRLKVCKRCRGSPYNCLVQISNLNQWLVIDWWSMPRFQSASSLLLRCLQVCYLVSTRDHDMFYCNMHAYSRFNSIVISYVGETWNCVMIHNIRFVSLAVFRTLCERFQTICSGCQVPLVHEISWWLFAARKSFKGKLYQLG